jgi:hypothetical protein
MINLSKPKNKAGEVLSDEQVQAKLPKPFPIEIEFEDAIWEVWVDWRRISPALANAYMTAYAKAALDSKECEDNLGLRAGIAAMAQQLLAFGHVDGASPKGSKNKKTKNDDALTLDEVNQVETLTRQMRDKASEAVLQEIIATAQSQPELYAAKCAVAAAAIVRFDENGNARSVGEGGQAALNYPGFDPTEDNLLLTGQIGPALVEAIIGVWNPTSAGSLAGKTPRTGAVNSTGSPNTLKPAETPANSPDDSGS